MPKRHTPHDIERGLTALAVAGNSTKAADMTGFNERTIRKWREQHAAKYADIETRRAAIIDAACITEFREIVLAATTATREAVALTHSQLQHDAALPARRHELLAQIAHSEDDATRDAIKAEHDALERQTRDPAGAAKNLATTAAIASDKIALMEGRPTSIIQHRSADDVLRELDRLGVVESTAEELPDSTPADSPADAFLPARA